MVKLRSEGLVGWERKRLSRHQLLVIFVLKVVTKTKKM